MMKAGSINPNRKGKNVYTESDTLTYPAASETRGAQIAHAPAARFRLTPIQILLSFGIAGNNNTRLADGLANLGLQE